MVLAELTHSAARGDRQVRSTLIAGLVSAFLTVFAVVQLFTVPPEALFPFIFCAVVAGLVALMFLWMSNAYRKRLHQKLLLVTTEGVEPGGLALVLWSELTGIAVMRGESGRPRNTPMGGVAKGMLASVGIADGTRQIRLDVADAAVGSYLVDLSVGTSPTEFDAAVLVLSAEAAKRDVPVLEG